MFGLLTTIWRSISSSTTYITILVTSCKTKQKKDDPKVTLTKLNRHFGVHIFQLFRCRFIHLKGDEFDVAQRRISIT